MVSFEETNGQHFQLVRETASFGKARFWALFVLVVLERTRGINQY
jgi:hypothetical protein